MKIILTEKQYSDLNETLSLNDKVGNFKVISDVKGHSTRPFGNWESDNAWDLGAQPGTTVHSYTKGVVEKVFIPPTKTEKIFGAQVTIKGIDGYPSIFYTHLDGVTLKPGKKVNVGDYIGKIAKWKELPHLSHVHIGLEFGNELSSIIEKNKKLSLDKNLNNKLAPNQNIFTKVEKHMGDTKIVTTYDDTYDYMRYNNKYFFKRKNNNKWLRVKNSKLINILKSKVFKPENNKPLNEQSTKTETLLGRKFIINHDGTVSIYNNLNEPQKIRITTSLGDINVADIEKVGNEYKITGKNGVSQLVGKQVIIPLMSFVDRNKPTVIKTGDFTPDLVLKKL